MSRHLKNILIAVAAIAVIICVMCCLYIFQYFRGSMVGDKVSQLAVTSAADTAPPGEMTTDEKPDTDKSAEKGGAADDGTVAPVIDFDALEEVNEEIYAWIEVPGTGISYAVVQSATDDLFYNTHAVDQSYFTGGSIYSQRYNTKSFEDPVTVLYGHNRKDQTFFAQLHNFADADFFAENREIIIYTRDMMYRYTIFAAYPHSSEHLLLCHDFSDEEQFTAYFDDLSDVVINANYDRDYFPKFGDKVLTLSTCYRLSRSQRYLVQGVLTESYPVADGNEEP